MTEQLHLVPELKIEGNKVVATSLDLARVTHAQHKNVLQGLRKLIDESTDEFGRLNFQPMSYPDSYGREQTGFNLTRNGVVRYLAKFGGIESAEMIEAYINQFDAMEAKLLSTSPTSTAAIDTLAFQAALAEALKPMQAQLSGMKASMGLLGLVPDVNIEKTLGALANVKLKPRPAFWINEYRATYAKYQTLSPKQTMVLISIARKANALFLHTGMVAA